MLVSLKKYQVNACIRKNQEINVYSKRQILRNKCLIITIEFILDHATSYSSPLRILPYFEKILYQLLTMSLSTH
jgi:hypothetical protein